MARRREDAHAGRAGQLAVMAELLARGCNAAVPEVDEGTDVIAFREDRPEYARLQVKTARAAAYRRGDGYGARFSVPLRQLLVTKPADDLFYVFAVRSGDHFTDFVIVHRMTLRDWYENQDGFGSADSEENLILLLQFRDRVLCGTVDLTAHRGAWHLLPPLSPR